jgi:hypothetical protein
MFYTFIVLFEKSSTLIDLMDLCKDFIVKRRKVTHLSLMGWGCYRESSRGKEHNIFWKILWSLQVPNSTKVFLWRACNNILPTKENLLKKEEVNDDLCLICNRDQETAQHVLWECPSAADVWCNTPSPLRLGLSPFFFYNKIFAKIHKSIRVLDFSKSTINV